VSFATFCISHPSVVGAESASNPSFSPTLTFSLSYFLFHWHQTPFEVLKDIDILSSSL
jgi:hypothetical protein